jgi:phospholipase C
VNAVLPPAKSKGPALIVALAALLAASRAPAAIQATVPHLNHVIVVIMENKSYAQAGSQPYTAGLMAAGSYCSNSSAVTHPSQPNYIALWAGSPLGVISDVCPAPGSPFGAENLGHACEAAGLTWRAYSENLSAASSVLCTNNGTLYTRKHDPWTNFNNLTHLNERPYTDLAADIAGNTLPNLVFVIPNNCNNTHDCTLAVGDTWLSNNIPALVAAAGPTGCVILTWDEDDNTSFNHILTVFAGPPVNTGYVSPGAVNHYNVLRTICDALGLAPFGNAANATPITDVWVPTIAVENHAWGSVKTLYR